MDALEPKTLRTIADRAITSWMDVPLFNGRLTIEQREADELTKKLAKL